MKIGNFGVLAGAAFLVLCGTAQAKTNVCGCRSASKAIHRSVVRHAPSARKVSRARYARTYSTHDEYYDYYDYYQSREVSEGLESREGYYQRQEWQSQAATDEGGSDYYYGYSGSTASGPPTQLRGRDFDGGVGYGQNGDMGYQGGYGGRGYGGYDMNGRYDMNGGAMSDAAAARFSVWHGYNSHNGIGNGY